MIGQSAFTAKMQHGNNNNNHTKMFILENHDHVEVGCKEKTCQLEVKMVVGYDGNSAAVRCGDHIGEVA